MGVMKGKCPRIPALFEEDATLKVMLQRVWHADPLERPTVAEMRVVWEAAFSAYLG